MMLVSVLLISGAGLVTLHLFSDQNPFFTRQLVWLGISLTAFFIFAHIDFTFLRERNTIVALYGFIVAVLAALFLFGVVAKGAQSRFDLGFLAIQPADPAKLVVIALLAKYFSRRHVEIAHFKHILVSGLYAFLVFALIAVQPDFGSAIIIFAIWFGIVLVSGISKKHLALVVLAGVLAGALMWNFVFQDYQKQRVMTFLNPLADISGTGYNAYQATIAVGSGQLWGKGVGYGTQSKLQFLPEYETDFIFAAFAEEWGFAGVVLLFIAYAVLMGRLLVAAYGGATNFETLFILGVAIYFLAHIIIHIGINVGLLPVTGTTVPFMSYGGSHLLTEFMALGMVNSMRRFGRTTHKADLQQEFVGV
jgi:rod shape determining protein RodA